MSFTDRAAEPPDEDWGELLQALRDGGADRGRLRRQLVRWLSDALPEEEMPRLVAALSSEALRRRAARFEASLALARAALSAGELAAARREAEGACSVDPLRWEAHQLLGEILEHSGDPASALTRYGMAMHLGWEGAEAKAAVDRVSPAGARPRRERKWWRHSERR